jgi:hypothetical protein
MSARSGYGSELNEQISVNSEQKETVNEEGCRDAPAGRLFSCGESMNLLPSEKGGLRRGVSSSSAFVRLRRDESVYLRRGFGKARPFGHFLLTGRKGYF